MNILTEGFGLPDAIEMARDAIGANGITLQDLGKEIPVPSDISDIDIKNGPFDNTGISHVSFVDIDFDEYRVLQERFIKMPLCKSPQYRPC